MKNNEKNIPVLVVDFGSQTTQLILRRIRELGVYCEIVSYKNLMFEVKKYSPKASVNFSHNSNLVISHYKIDYIGSHFKSLISFFN